MKAAAKSNRSAEPQLGIEDTAERTPKWRHRGYLPHFDAPSRTQFITFRLKDSVPREKLEKLEQEIQELAEEEQKRRRRSQIEKWLDAGYGCCALRHPLVARIMEETLWREDGKRYELVAWCIMPNHVHVLITPHIELGKILQSWKSFTGRWALAHNAELGLGAPETNAFWMREYFDRFIRDERHFKATLRYIHDNPVKAGLCKTPVEWVSSSSRIFEG